MRAKKLLTSRQIFRYAVPARTVTKKALVLPFWYRLTRVVPEKCPLNGCVLSTELILSCQWLVAQPGRLASNVIELSS